MSYDDVTMVSDGLFAEIGACPQCESGRLELAEKDKDCRIAECDVCHLRIAVTTRHNANIYRAMQLAIIAAAFFIGLFFGGTVL